MCFKKRYFSWNNYFSIGPFCDTISSVVLPGFTTCPAIISNNCQNNGTCVSNGTVINCICSAGFTGFIFNEKKF